MTDFRFSVAAEVFETFPSYIVGWVAATIEQEQADQENLIALLRAAEQRTRTIFEGKDLKEHVAIATWRSAFSSLGWSASKYPASIEALAKRVVRGYELPTINPAVDLANVASLTYLVPVGCHDMVTTGDLTVRPATQADIFLPMGSADPEVPAQGEFVYASDHQIRTRRWVWRQSRDALVQPGSTRLFFPVDGFDPATASSVDAALHFLASALRDELGGKVTSGLVSSDNRSLVLEIL